METLTFFNQILIVFSIIFDQIRSILNALIDFFYTIEWKFDALNENLTDFECINWLFLIKFWSFFRSYLIKFGLIFDFFYDYGIHVRLRPFRPPPGGGGYPPLVQIHFFASQKKLVLRNAFKFWVSWGYPQEIDENLEIFVFSPTHLRKSGFGPPGPQIGRFGPQNGHFGPPKWSIWTPPKSIVFDPQIDVF